MGASEPDDPASPRPLHGYELGALLGRGGMGEVHSARDHRIDREVAVKRIRQLNPSSEAVVRFTREARIQARLDHPAIVPVHELGEDADGRPYFTMKRLAGVTLAERLVDGGPLQPLLRPLVDVCFAIAHAHSRNIVHRDLKPSNIMLGDYGEVYVLDWGVARELGTVRTSQPAIAAEPATIDTTKTGAILGTPGYMAPEQLHGAEVTTAFDVFALGAILFEILAAERLHPPGEKAIASTLTFAGDSPARRRPDRAIAPELDAACALAIADDPAARPTALELAERIQRYLDGDRDVERRRALAAQQLEAARAALAAGERATAVHDAGRALALDPESIEAATLVTELIIAPPPELPAELTAALADSERELHRQHSRRGARLVFAIIAVVPFLPFVEVKHWLSLAALVGSGCAMGVISTVNARTGKVPPIVVMCGAVVVAIAFSRLSSPFVVTPMIVLALAFALAARPILIRRTGIMLAFVSVATLLPFAFEWLGVFDPTWRVDSGTLQTWSTVFAGDRPVDIALVIVGNLAVTLVVARYAVVVMRAHHAAQRRVEIQAWHLRQLLPRVATAAT